MSEDLLTITIGLASFFVFFLIQIIIARRAKSEHIVRMLRRTVLLSLCFPTCMMSSLFFLNVINNPWPQIVWMTILSSLIHIALCFIYVICVFGFYESSIRLRVLCEIEKQGIGGVFLEDIQKNYNDEVITQLRLRRLLDAGYISEKKGLYSRTKTRNVYSLLEIISSRIRRNIG